MNAVVVTLTAEHRTGMTTFLTAVEEPARAALLDQGSGTSSSPYSVCLVSALNADNLGLMQQQQNEENYTRAYYPHLKISNIADIINEANQPNLQRLVDSFAPEFDQSAVLSKAFDTAVADITLSTHGLSRPSKNGEVFLVSLLSTSTGGDVLRYADRSITDNGNSTIVQVLFDIYIDTVRNDPVLGNLSVALDYRNSLNQPDVFHATVVQLLDEDLMSEAPIGLRSDFEFGTNEPVNVLLDRSGEGKTTLYGQLWRYFTEFLVPSQVTCPSLHLAEYLQW
jgi:hypothetical protein